MKKGSKRRRVIERSSSEFVVYLECGHVATRLYRPGDWVFCSACPTGEPPITEHGRFLASTPRTETPDD